VAQNHIRLVERRFEDARYAAVVVAANRKDAIALCGMRDPVGFSVRNIGTASKNELVRVVIADVHGGADDEEYSVR